MAASRDDQCALENKHRIMTEVANKETQVKQNTSKDLLYSEKYSENLLSDRLNVLTAKGRQPHCGISPETFRVPKSSVLSQVKNFLPQMEAADHSLKELVKSVPSGQLDIENIDGCSGPVIEMNLALAELNNSCSDDEDRDDSSSDSDSEGLVCDKTCSPVTEDSLKLNGNLPKRKPCIVELDKCNLETSDTSDIIER